MEINDNNQRVIQVVEPEKSTEILGPNMIAIHPKSKVYVDKNDILKIFTDKPALYSVRLAELVFGVQNLAYSKMPDDKTSSYPPLNAIVLDSIISKFIKIHQI